MLLLLSSLVVSVPFMLVGSAFVIVRFVLPGGDACSATVRSA
jgi:hypothetical protein